MTSGFTLHYDGAKFGPNTPTIPSFEGERKAETATEKLAQMFSNIGALVIRYQIGQGQRAGVIQQISRQNYESNPIQKPANGADQTDLFETEFNLTPACAATRRLEKAAHRTLGKNKILNERGQPLVHTNKGKLSGEQDLWGKMHATVWHTGIDLAGQLSKQGFLYICCPVGMGREDYDLINQEMSAGKFKVDGNEIVVAGRRFQTYDPKQFYVNRNSVHLDPELVGTFQENGLLVDAGKGKAPLGWMIHRNNTKIVPGDMLEDLVRTIRISQGGFHDLSPGEQTLIQAGRLKNTNGLGLFEQNQTFNAMYVICDHLEKEYGFNSELLFGTSLTVASKRVAEFFTDLVNVEDFLTGPILTEMVQSLRVTRSASKRKELPLRFTNPFIVTDNNVKAIAYAFDAQYNGMPLFQLESMEKNECLLDVHVKGQLALPSLSYGKHASAILATSILVSEQVLLEQLIREAFVKDGKEGVVDLLMLIPINEEIACRIAELAADAKSDANGPILGLQFDYCDEMVALLRPALGFNLLIELTQKLEQEGKLTDEALEELYQTHPKEELFRAFTTLKGLADYIQRNPSTSAEAEGSSGIAAGLEPLLAKLFPEKFRQKGTFQVPGVTRQQLEEANIKSTSVTSTTSAVSTNADAVEEKNGRAEHLNILGSYAKQAFDALVANGRAIPWIVFMAMITAGKVPLI